MSDHVDGDTPAPARDAAGGRLTDEQAACLAAYLAGGNGPDAGLGMAVQMDIVDAGDDDVEALARVVLAWRPAVAAARRQTAYADEGTRPLPILDRPHSNWLIATHNTEEAVRAMDGAE